MQRTPRRIPEAAPSGPLDPELQRVYDAIDGQFAEPELALVAGVAPARVSQLLDVLVGYGLVTFEAEPAPIVEEKKSNPEHADGIQLSGEERAFFEDYAQRIKTADHYELLGLWRDATKDEVKKAYYKLAPKFHPDKYYGRELGHYKAMVAEIFDRLTAAHDTLRYKKKRAAYDASLPPMRAGARIRRRPEPSDRGETMRPSTPSMSPSGPGYSMPPEGGDDAWSDRPSDPGRVSHVAPTSAPHGRPSTHPGASRESLRPSIPAMKPSVRRRMRRTARHAPLDPEQRRIQAEALARRLGKAPPRATTSSGPRRGAATEVRTTQKTAEELAERQSGAKKSAAEVYRDRYSSVGSTAKENRLQKYLQQGYTFMEAGDYRAALAAFQQALRLSPGDAMIEENIQRATRAAMGG